ncbi:unnamed protein product [Effrenium voratum]|nr:unnamed protein product [Effrenium voratum]
MALLSDSKEFAATWLANRWLCWGAGGGLAVLLGTVVPMCLLELAIAKKWFPKESMVEYSTDGTRSREELIERTQRKVPFKQQLLRTIWTLGPVAWMNVLAMSVLMPKIVRKPTAPGIAPLVAMYVLADLGLYWFHRVQHEVEFLWRFHQLHHELETPTPVGTSYIDPVDATLQVGLPLVLSSAVVQPHPLVFYATVALRTMENVMNHSGVDDPILNLITLKCLPLRASPRHHDRHHKYCNHLKARNYGEGFWIWDWIFGTLT